MHLKHFRIFTSAFSLLVSCALISCDDGVSVTVCRVQPAKKELLCVGPTNNVTHINYADANSYLCKPTEDEATFLKLCEQKQEKCGVGFTPTLCLLNAATEELLCLDPKDRSFSVPLAQAESYVCKTKADERVMLEYCMQRCRV